MEAYIRDIAQKGFRLDEEVLKMRKFIMMLRTFLLIAAIGYGGCATGQGATEEQKGPDHESRHAPRRFQDADRWARAFEDPARDRWQKPDEVVAAMGIQPTSIIADIGSATGYFPVRFARTAEKGRVYGIDIEPDMVRYLNERAKREGIGNLKSILGGVDDPKIPEPVDIAFLSDTYHHIENRVAYFKGLKRYFRPHGKLVIVDFMKGQLPVGPSDHMKISKKQVIEELRSAGYSHVPSDFTLPYQYFLVFKPDTHKP